MIFERLSRQDLLRAVGLEPGDPRGDHAVPDFGPVVLAERLRLNLDPAAVELAASAGRDVVGVDRDGCRPDLLDPAVGARLRMPRHHHGQLLGRRRADRLEDFGLAGKNDLASHLRRDDVTSQSGGVHILEVEAQVDPAARERQALRERQDSRAANRRANEEPASSAWTSARV